jgi:hypothetical protein
MSFAVRRAAFQAARTQRAPITQQTRRYATEENRDVLRTGAKRDPELYVRPSKPKQQLPDCMITPA